MEFCYHRSEQFLNGSVVVLFFRKRLLGLSNAVFMHSCKCYLDLVLYCYLYTKVKFSHSTQFHKCITHEQYWDTGSYLSINFVSFSHVNFSLSNLLLDISNPLGCYFSILCLSKVKYWSTSKEGMWLTWLLSSTKPQIYFYQWGKNEVRMWLWTHHWYLTWTISISSDNCGLQVSFDLEGGKGY